MTLNNVAETLGRAARRVVIKHPNSLPCQVFRMIINRSEPNSGGAQTLGGLGNLTPDDEWDYDWEQVGIGWALRAQGFEPALMMDRQDAHNETGDEFRYLIEPLDEPGTENWFQIKNQDVVYMLKDDTTKLAFEVVGAETVTDIAPFAKRYVLQRSDNLDVTVSL
jgi:hypothetical protein